MASGQKHDQATKRWSLILGIVIAIFIDLQTGFLVCITFLLGGLWLSPDLDTQSNALFRWGFFKSLWWPYRKLIRHRSIFSHGPIIGTSLRIGYIFFFITIIIFLLNSLKFSSSINSLDLLKNQLRQYPKESLLLFLSLEASAWLHIIKDGDPAPTEWYKKTKKR